jgi:WD40 repeat protein
MAWSPDDARLASVGAGGACYQWDVPAGVKIAHEEFVDKQKNYSCVQFCNNSSTSGVVVRSLDGKIQHIQVCLPLLMLQVHLAQSAFKVM